MGFFIFSRACHAFALPKRWILKGEIKHNHSCWLAVIMHFYAK